MKLILAGLLCLVSGKFFAIINFLKSTIVLVSAQSFQPGFSLSPGLPGSIPSSPLGLPQPGIGQPGLGGIAQPGIGQPGLGGIPQPSQPLKKRGIDSAENFRQFSLPTAFSPPASFSPAVFGGSNSPVFMTVSPPVFKRNVDRKVPTPTGGKLSPHMKRGLFGGDETTPRSAPILPTGVTTGLPRVKKAADLLGVVTASTPLPTVPRLKRGLFGSDPVSTGLPVSISIPTVKPPAKRR